jgi:aldehyde dehydrogenase (NAD+)
LTETLAAHDDVDGMWYFPADGGGADVERLSASNMKRTWVAHARERDWWDPRQGEPPEFLRHATQIKNIWVPYGE